MLPRLLSHLPGAELAAPRAALGGDIGVERLDMPRAEGAAAAVAGAEGWPAAARMLAGGVGHAPPFPRAGRLVGFWRASPRPSPSGCGRRAPDDCRRRSRFRHPATVDAVPAPRPTTAPLAGQAGKGRPDTR